MGGPTVEGVDYAFILQHPDIPSLAAMGFVFACRYVGAGTTDKHLTRAEADTLHANGIAVVSNVEGAANGLLGGYETGRNWAQRAHAHALECGMPPSRPIYLSVDFPVTDMQWRNYVRNAFQGAADELGADRVGIYGSSKAMEWARRDHAAQWFWQTYAWSNGYWVPGNHIEQYQNGVSLAGGTVDLNRALTTDFGQWGPVTVKDDTMRIVVNSGRHYLTNGIVRWPIEADGSVEDKIRVWGAPVPVDNLDHFGPVVTDAPPPAGGITRADVRDEIRAAFRDGGIPRVG